MFIKTHYFLKYSEEEAGRLEPFFSVVVLQRSRGSKSRFVAQILYVDVDTSLSALRSGYISLKLIKSHFSVCRPSAGHRASKSSPGTGLEWPRGFQEVKVPRFHDNGTGWW